MQSQENITQLKMFLQNPIVKEELIKLHSSKKYLDHGAMLRRILRKLKIAPWENRRQILLDMMTYDFPYNYGLGFYYIREQLGFNPADYYINSGVHKDDYKAMFEGYKKEKWIFTSL